MKQIILGIIAIAGVFFVASYSSCTRDECAVKVCRTRGSRCESGICKCPTGVYGANCEVEYRSKYAGEYRGTAPADTFTLAYNSLVFLATDDTVNYKKMELIWIDSASMYMAPKLPIELVNMSATGSQFVIMDTTSTAGLIKYSGYGSINGQTVTMNLTRELLPSPGPKETYIFETYLRRM